jgi:diguanylate cyclase (GGDEF)-like protein
LHERNEQLRVALQALSVSKAEIESQNQELVRLATRDSLTGSLNRRAFMAEADKLFAKARAQGTPLACVMCDIDHFKSINDRFGHAAGDQVIQAAAKALDGAVRLGAIVGRYGGEEFCLMVDGVTLPQAMEIGERMRAEVQATVGGSMRDHPGVVVTMSFGVAPLEPGTRDPAALIDFADQALYHSKQHGRNRVTAWPEVHAQRTADAAT